MIRSPRELDLRCTPLLLAATLLAACGGSAPESTQESAAKTVAQPREERGAAALRALYDEAWERELRENPLLATYHGDARYNDRLPDLRPEAIEARKAGDRALLDRLKAVDRDALPPAGQLNLDLLRRHFEDRVEGQAFNPELMPLDGLDGVHLLAQIADFTPFATVKDYEHWLARLQGYGELVDQTIALMRRGMAEGRLRPRIAMNRAVQQIAAQRVTRPQDSAFYAPFTRYPDAVPAEIRTQLDLAAQSVVQDTVLPALQRLHEFMEKTYLPACPDIKMGLSAQPRGAEFYAWQVRRHTGTRLTPDEIHDIGLREVARLRTELAALMRRSGHSGSIARFQDRLNADPRYRVSDPARLLEAYRAVGKRIDPELQRLFRVLPRTPYGMRAIADVAAPAAPAAYYYPPAADGSRAGYVYVNTSRPETRPLWAMEALIAHEAVPGHHLQFALAQELEDVPAYRKHGLELTTFVEGWALYAESLGEEIGLYQDPGARFGQLSFEMWRAVRLVVDTGLHAKGWTRRKAREYFAEHVPKSDSEVAAEVDRYLVMPGQALAYKIGELKIRELRTRAEQTLGTRFDLRDFHHVVLGSGALPLDLLERNVDAWIAAQRDGAVAQPAGS